MEHCTIWYWSHKYSQNKLQVPQCKSNECMCMYWCYKKQWKECTWKHRRRASSPCEFLRLENPQRISRISTVPSRLLSKRSKILGARGINEDMFIAFSTCSNSDWVALSPFEHLQFVNDILPSWVILKRLVIGLNWAHVSLVDKKGSIIYWYSSRRCLSLWFFSKDHLMLCTSLGFGPVSFRVWSEEPYPSKKVIYSVRSAFLTNSYSK
jgi:hypothetical protein